MFMQPLTPEQDSRLAILDSQVEDVVRELVKVMKSSTIVTLPNASDGDQKAVYY